LDSTDLADLDPGCEQIHLKRVFLKGLLKGCHLVLDLQRIEWLLTIHGKIIGEIRKQIWTSSQVV
jgi:hypothetical protein